MDLDVIVRSAVITRVKIMFLSVCRSFFSETFTGGDVGDQTVNRKSRKVNISLSALGSDQNGDNGGRTGGRSGCSCMTR